MNILILGGGGREHALAWATKQNPKCDRLIVAPGNAGIAKIATCAELNIEDGSAVVGFAEGVINFTARMRLAATRRGAFNIPECRVHLCKRNGARFPSP